MDPLYRSYLYEPETVDDPNRQTQIVPEFAPVGNLSFPIINPYLAAKYAADRNLLCHSSVNLATLVAQATPFR